jgi:hypothetical protein
MTEHDSKKPTRTDIDAPLSREDAEQSTRTHSQTIPGATSPASSAPPTSGRRPPTTAARAARTSRRHRGRSVGPRRDRAPRDES